MSAVGWACGPGDRPLAQSRLNGRCSLWADPDGLAAFEIAAVGVLHKHDLVTNAPKRSRLALSADRIAPEKRGLRCRGAVRSQLLPSIGAQADCGCLFVSSRNARSPRRPDFALGFATSKED